MLYYRSHLLVASNFHIHFSRSLVPATNSFVLAKPFHLVQTAPMCSLAGDGVEHTAQQSPHVTQIEDVHSLKWLKLQKIHYITAKGQQAVWERVARTTTTEGSVDAVTMVCLLYSSKNKEIEPKIILVKQFRPPLGKHTIELPAGLIDKGETPQQAGVRELLEETGYTGRVVSSSPVLTLCPGVCSEQIHQLMVLIDVDAAGNEKPKQNLQDHEDIQVLTVPVSQLKQELQRQSDMGHVAFDAVWALSLGLKYAAREMIEAAEKDMGVAML
eukprot:GDKI01018957.1.p1 GENE.GDKI01018957.1~~GDKI01018957.1.p1  ORF type:complete len:271 (-),score=54.34 GDKI01018957.1:242-1054(-)